MVDISSGSDFLGLASNRFAPLNYVFYEGWQGFQYMASMISGGDLCCEMIHLVTTLLLFFFPFDVISSSGLPLGPLMLDGNGWDFGLYSRSFLLLRMGGLLLHGCWEVDNLAWRCNLALGPGLQKFCGSARIFTMK